MGRVKQEESLMWVAVRKTLKTVADMAARLEGHEFDRFKDALLAELRALKRGGKLSEIWRQATANLTGPESYGLQRIGLWPEEQDGKMK